MTSDQIFAFGNFVLDPAHRSLVRGKEEVALGQRSFVVLEMLVANAGEVVSKRELMEAVWPDVTVGEDSLFHAISDALLDVVMKVRNNRFSEMLLSAPGVSRLQVEPDHRSPGCGG